MIRILKTVHYKNLNLLFNFHKFNKIINPKLENLIFKIED
jgi:hypothetical protein